MSTVPSPAARAWDYMTYDRGPRLIFDSTEPDPG